MGGLDVRSAPAARAKEVGVARVLFVTPAVPAADRNGVAMRAGVGVEALRERHDLTVAVVRSPFDTSPFDWVRAHAERVVEVLCSDDPRSAMSWLSSPLGRAVARGSLPPLARFRPPSLGEMIVEEVGDDFDAVVVMGTCTAGAAIPFLERGVGGVLDAFDDDARTCASLAQLDPTLLDDVPVHEAFQREVYGWFDRVLLASLDDAVAPDDHLPNAVRIPPHTARPADRSPIGLLFVGNPGYLPNRDALTRLQRHIVPAVEARGVAVRLLHPGPDDDIDDFYAEAHIAAVPLRAGGGTRIKILEAFAHHCPVVSTPTGAMGLGVTGGEHLVLTSTDDDDGAFADAVVSLVRDADRRARLTDAAFAFVTSHHDHRDVGARLAAIVERVIAERSDPLDEPPTRADPAR
jgi:hypothetical protein